MDAFSCIIIDQSARSFRACTELKIEDCIFRIGVTPALRLRQMTALRQKRLFGDARKIRGSSTLIGRNGT